MAQWLSALYCSASCATRDSGFAPRLCRNRPQPGGPWGGVRVKEGLAGREILVSSLTSDSCGGPGAVRAKVARWLASGLDGAGKKQLGWVVHRRTHDFHVSPE